MCINHLSDNDDDDNDGDGDGDGGEVTNRNKSQFSASGKLVQPRHYIKGGVSIFISRTRVYPHRNRTEVARQRQRHNRNVKSMDGLGLSQAKQLHNPGF